MKKSWVIILLTIIAFNLYAGLVRAVTPTPEVTKGLEQKIQEIREEVKKKVREKIELTRKGQKAAYFGSILEINDQILVLDTLNGERSVSLANETTIIGKNNKSLTLKDLVVGNYVIAMGYLTDNDLLETKRLVVISEPKINPTQIVYGKISDISKDEQIVSLKNEKKNLIYTIYITDKTVITKKIGSSIKKVKFTDLAENDYLVAIGTPGENEEKMITAKLIHVIPGLTKVSPTPTPSI